MTIYVSPSVLSVRHTSPLCYYAKREKKDHASPFGLPIGFTTGNIRALVSTLRPSPDCPDFSFPGQSTRPPLDSTASHYAA